MCYSWYFCLAGNSGYGCEAPVLNRSLREHPVLVRLGRPAGCLVPQVYGEGLQGAPAVCQRPHLWNKGLPSRPASYSKSLSGMLKVIIMIVGNEENVKAL